jgi:hypothetical protein
MHASGLEHIGLKNLCSLPDGQTSFDQSKCLESGRRERDGGNMSSTAYLAGSGTQRRRPMAPTKPTVPLRKAQPPRRPIFRHDNRVRLSQVLLCTPGAFEPNKISVVERYVTDVDVVPDRFLDVEVLFLSHNSISTFAGFLQVFPPFTVWPAWHRNVLTVTLRMF